MTMIPLCRWLLPLLALAGMAVPGPATANDPYSVCRVGLDANEPRAFIACIEPLRGTARDRLESYRQRLEVSEELIGKIIAQGGRDAPTACAQSRVTLAELEAEARRLGDLETEATALRDAWREAAVGLSRARGSAQIDQTTPVVIGYNILAGRLFNEADAIATSLRAARNYLVRVDPAGLCVGQPAAAATTATPGAGTQSRAPSGQRTRPWVYVECGGMRVRSPMGPPQGDRWPGSYQLPDGTPGFQFDMRGSGNDWSGTGFRTNDPSRRPISCRTVVVNEPY